MNDSKLSIQNSKFPVICLTGQMAAGKNYICNQLMHDTSDGSCCAIDLDKTVHEAIDLLCPVILQEFSGAAEKKGIVLSNPDGTLNRRALGQLIFQDQELLKKQESIVYPFVIETVKKFIAENQGKTVIINATVLYKTPELMELCDVIYFVTAPALKRLIRARRRDKMPFTQILKRFHAQKDLLSLYQKTGKPVVTIKN